MPDVYNLNGFNPAMLTPYSTSSSPNSYLPQSGGVNIAQNDPSRYASTSQSANNWNALNQAPVRSISQFANPYSWMYMPQASSSTPNSGRPLLGENSLSYDPNYRSSSSTPNSGRPLLGENSLSYDPNYRSSSPSNQTAPVNPVFPFGGFNSPMYFPFGGFNSPMYQPNNFYQPASFAPAMWTIPSTPQATTPRPAYSSNSIRPQSMMPMPRPAYGMPTYNNPNSMVRPYFR